ncbi:diguanylate cyclase [Amycolatopsis sp. NPDC059021]|uniref:GGDEF domain-containing protein n=1 Tax=Amycolatopsis sp. NPDC059021 TaxID=3346704 RepID=UPI00366BB8CB
MTDAETAPDGSGSGKAGRHPYDPRAWALWKHPRRVIVYLLVMDALALLVFAFTFAASAAPGELDWLRFGILAAGATVHIQFTQRQEESRRAGTSTVLIDLTAVWVFPAVLTLPPILTVALIAIIRAQRWFTARRPANTFLFASISHSVAAVLGHLAFISLGEPNWMSLSPLESLWEFGLVVFAAVVYEGVQIVYIGGVIALSAGKQAKLRNILGSKQDNILEAVTTGLGAITAVLLIVLPPAVAIMAVVTVIFNRLAELDQLLDDVRTDSKTGVLNMRGWSEAADRALTRTARSDEKLALLMIDLDHFKWINDTYGHPAGDDVLRDIAQALDEVTRPSDVVGRFGGEEFLVLLPDIDETSAREAAERVRSAVAKLHIVTTDKRGGQTTISDRTTSIGVALYPEHGTTMEQLLQAADAAVYVAKENGRNQVRLAPDDTP